MYVLSTWCPWAAIPKDLPPRSTVNYGSKTKSALSSSIHEAC